MTIDQAETVDQEELTIYQIEITKKDTGKVVKRFNFKVDLDTAYEMFGEWAGRYDSTHRLELSKYRTGQLVPEGRQSGYAEHME
jgi:hypothetical protein